MNTLFTFMSIKDKSTLLNLICLCIKLSSNKAIRYANAIDNLFKNNFGL